MQFHSDQTLALAPLDMSAWAFKRCFCANVIKKVSGPGPNDIFLALKLSILLNTKTLYIASYP